MKIRRPLHSLHKHGGGVNYLKPLYENHPNMQIILIGIINMQIT